MTSVADLTTRDLTWRYPAEEGQPFVLQDEGREIGCLEFHEEPGASAGQFGEKRWLFRYTTKLRPRVTVYSEDLQHKVAEFVPSLIGGGLVTFDSGERYRWRKVDLLGTRWCFSHLKQKASVCFSQQAGRLSQGGKVTVCCGAADLPETPVLLLLAWFLRILDFEMLVEGVFRVG